MSKELEAFMDILGILSAVTGCDVDTDSEHIKIVKQALQRLESIDNAEPSEALKCLEHIKKDDFNMIITTYPPLPAYNGVTKDEMFDKIEQALLKAEKDEKIILGIEDYLNRRIKVEPLEDARKAFIEIRNQLQVVKEVLEWFLKCDHITLELEMGKM